MDSPRETKEILSRRQLFRRFFAVFAGAFSFSQFFSGLTKAFAQIGRWRNSNGALMVAWGRWSTGALPNGVNGWTLRQIGSSTNWVDMDVHISCGCAINSLGELWAWGWFAGSYSNTPVRVGSDTNWSKVAAGDGYILAIKTTGTLWGIGANWEGQLGVGDNADRNTFTQIGAGTNWTYVHAGNRVSFGIRGTGTLYAWGTTTVGGLGTGSASAVFSSPVQVGAFTDWTKVVSSRTGWEQPAVHGIRSNNTLWSWGMNDGGQLGLGDTTNRSAPTQIPGTTWTDVEFGSIARRSDATLWNWNYWSSNSPVQVGSGTSWVRGTKDGDSIWGLFNNRFYSITGFQSSGDPTLTADGQQVGAITTWSKMKTSSFGYGAHLALTSGGALYSFGWNQTTLGQGSASSPVQVGSNNWKVVAPGDTHTAAIREDGTLWVCGDPTITPNGMPQSTFVQVGTRKDWVDISGQSGCLFGIRANGTLWQWGHLGWGALGVSITSSPVQVGSDTDWERISADWFSFAALKRNGTLWVYGNNTDYQLGTGDNVTRSVPVQMGAATDWRTISMFYGHTAAVKLNGSLWVWGVNTNGELGLGDTTNRSSPVQVGALTNWAKASCNYGFTLATKTDGTLWAWGGNLDGCLGYGGGSVSSPIQIGALTTWKDCCAYDGFGLAIKTDGTLWAWGFNAHGAVGQNTSNYSYNSPVQIGAQTYWKSLPKSGVGTAFALRK